MSRRFQLVDVFNQDPLTGNPLAVVLDADDLTTESMMRITRWLNLSETTFLLSPLHPDADYRVRIFTLDRELPFAGHPTLGTCHAWIESGGKPRTPSEIVQECGAGLVSVRSIDNGRAFAAPNLIRSGPVDETKIGEVADFLRIHRASIVDAQWVDNGPGWVAILLDSAAAVLALEPPRAHVGRMDVGVVGSYPRGAPAAFELRAFFTDHLGAVREDPVTGSLNASVAQWLLRSGRASAPYTASQGSRLGHAGLISITQDALGAVWVGGRSTTLFSGTCSL
jgi:PhzF family phenazine biosynthesis protein